MLWGMNRNMKHVKTGLFIIFQLGLRVARLALIFSVLLALFSGNITNQALFNLMLAILIQLEIKPITVTQHIAAQQVTISGNTIANQYGAPCRCRCGQGDPTNQPVRGKKETSK